MDSIYENGSKRFFQEPPAGAAPDQIATYKDYNRISDLIRALQTSILEYVTVNDDTLEGLGTTDSPLNVVGLLELISYVKPTVKTTLVNPLVFNEPSLFSILVEDELTLEVNNTGAANWFESFYKFDIRAGGSIMFGNSFPAELRGDTSFINSFVENKVSFCKLYWDGTQVRDWSNKITNNGDVIDPELSLVSVSDITETAALFNATPNELVNIIWAVYVNETLRDNATFESVESGSSSVDFGLIENAASGVNATEVIEGLTASTNYYLRAFAVDLSNNKSDAYDVDFITIVASETIFDNGSPSDGWGGVEYDGGLPSDGWDLLILEGGSPSDGF